MAEKIIHSFGKTDPNHKCYKNWDTRTPTCGVTVKKEFVTNDIKKVTCKRCIKLEAKKLSKN